MEAQPYSYEPGSIINVSVYVCPFQGWFVIGEKYSSPFFLLYKIYPITFSSIRETSFQNKRTPYSVNRADNPAGAVTISFTGFRMLNASVVSLHCIFISLAARA